MVDGNVSAEGDKIMLRQVEFKIKLPQDIKINSSMGSVFHGALMDIVGAETAEWLHAQNASRPFNQCVYYNRVLGVPFWRITVLNEEAETRIMEPVINAVGKELFLRQKNYAIEIGAVTTDKSSSYQKIADDAFLSDDVPKGGSISMLTATSFKRDGEYVIMPEVYLIFQSLLNRWNLFSDKNKLVEQELDKELAGCCHIIGYSLYSQVFSLENSKVTGFRGDIRVRFRANEMVRRIMGMLFAYSQYAGLGIKTALGMGAVDAQVLFPR